MHHHDEPIKQFTFNEVRTALKLSRSGMYRQIEKDPSFPRPQKNGPARSCRVYFYGHEVAAWQLSRGADSVIGDEITAPEAP